MELTPQQSKAAYATGSVVVTAGAGTGKTAMLAERFLHHVKVDGMRPIEIVAATFTEKAADELRQRIRKQLAKNIDDEGLIAEVDAAQISTIHALAARICRDFYHLADLPADFRILDETESEIWLADKFDDAMGEVDETIVRELGYTWLKDAIRLLLRDPYSAVNTLGKDENEWKKAIDLARAESLSRLQNCDAWHQAASVCSMYSGNDGDNLENARRDAVNVMRDIETGENLSAAITTLRKLPAHLGQQGNWPDGAIGEMRKALKSLKSASNEKGPAWAVDLEFGDGDTTAAARIRLLSQAFSVVQAFLSRKKNENKVLDYADLEIYALEILQHENARQHYARRWWAFLIDEFQDTNHLQGEIIKRLRGDAKLTVVGDEKQSIYGFRRADVTVFREFKESIVSAGGDFVELSETFRAHENLVVALNDVFAPVLGNLHQPLDANRKEPPHQEIPMSMAIAVEKDASSAAAKIAESRYIAGEINRMFADEMTVFDKGTKQLRKIEYRDIAILSRKWSAIDVYIDALSAMGIPAVNAGGGSLLDTREAKDAIAMLAFLADTTDDISLVAVLRSPFFAISDRVLFEAAKTKQKDQIWWQRLQSSESDLRRAFDILSNLLAKKNKISPVGLLRAADAATGYAAVIANLPQGDRREADWTGFLAFLGKLGLAGRSDLFGAVRQIRALIDAESSIPRPPLDAGNAVQLMTIHKAKGLEWPVVFVPDLAAKMAQFGEQLLIDNELGIAIKLENDEGKKEKPAIYKLIDRRRKEREQDEVKRLLYVAVTRARDRVILTAGAESGPAIDIMRPGIEGAGIQIDPIPYSDELAMPPTPADPPLFQVPSFTHTGRLAAGLRTIPVTGLTEYAKCPLKFRYMYVDGHPGLGEGNARARTIGTLTHKALELDIDDLEKLRRVADGATADCVSEALRLAGNFRSHDAFKRFRGLTLVRECSFSFRYRDVNLLGVADLVGDDFVLDYKTDSEINPDEHRFQLWTYAAALDKPRAFIAYLRNPHLHEFSGTELAETAKTADLLTDRIAAGTYDAQPSPENCGRCACSSICPSAVNKGEVGLSTA